MFQKCCNTSTCSNFPCGLSVQNEFLLQLNCAKWTCAEFVQLNWSKNWVSGAPFRLIRHPHIPLSFWLKRANWDCTELAELSHSKNCVVCVLDIIISHTYCTHSSAVTCCTGSQRSSLHQPITKQILPMIYTSSNTSRQILSLTKSV